MTSGEDSAALSRREARHRRSAPAEPTPRDRAVTPTSSRGQKLADVNAQRCSQAFDVVERYVPLTTLDGTDVGPVQVCQVGEGFLRNAMRSPERTEVMR
jgi:hypothetical protein